MIPDHVDGVSVHPRPAPVLFGLMAEFETPDALVRATKAATAAGYSSMDAFTPYPIEEVNHEIAHHKPSVVSKLVFCGGLTGALVGFGFQTWTSVVAYPMNIGGRPLYSWPSFIIVTFELTILFAASTAVIGTFLLNRLPMPHHPVFSVERFSRASKDRYFLLIESRDPKFDRAATRAFLESQRPAEVSDVLD